MGAGEAVVTAEVGGVTASYTVAVTQKDAKVGDFYFSNNSWEASGIVPGKECIGMIFYVDPDNKQSGKIVSLDEATQLKWSIAEVAQPGANSLLDGAANLKAIKAVSDWEAKFDAEAWCAAKNGGDLNWYLPAIDELRQLFAASCGLTWVESGADESKNEINNWTGMSVTMLPGDNINPYPTEREAFNKKLTNIGATALNADGTTRYWSSTEYNDDFAQLLSFEGGYAMAQPRQYFHVGNTRAIAVFPSVKEDDPVVVEGVTPPYTNTFDNASSLDGFTILDDNKDEITWKIEDGAAACTYNEKLQMDDWLITVPLQFEGDKTYTVGLTAWTNGHYETVELKYGDAPAASAMTNELVAPVELTPKNYGREKALTLAGVIKPAESGVYYIGIHGISEADNYTLFVDDLEVKEEEPAVTGVVPPYSNTFDNTASLEGYTTLDENKDEITWKIEDGAAACTYNEKLQMDDWLITMPLYLEGGSSYEVGLNAWTNGHYETVELKFGDAPTAAAMSNVVVAATELGPKNYGKDKAAHLTGVMKPATTGIYYLGIHGISEADQYTLFVDDLEIAAERSGMIPGIVTDLKATVAGGASKDVTIEFNAPTLSASGETLTSDIAKIELYRSGAEAPIKTYEKVAPGTKITATDTPEKAGEYTYTVIAYNEVGAGDEATVTVYCGLGVPQKLTGVTITETETGTVMISWDAVTKDVLGQELTDKEVTYTVYSIDDWGDYTPVKSDIAATSCTLANVGPETGQEFMRYAVGAVDEAGVGQIVPTAFIPVGTPYNGMDESFPNGQMGQYAWQRDASLMASWTTYTDETGYAAADGDNGYIAFSASGAGDTGHLVSAKITLADMTKPQLSFYTYNFNTNGDDNNILGVSVRKVGGEYAELLAGTVNTLTDGKEGWGKLTVDLSAYQGEVIQLSFAAKAVNYGSLLIDNIVVAKDPSAGVEEVATDAVIAVAGHDIVISGAAEAGVTIIAINGCTIYTGQGDATVTVLPGVYVVKVGDKVVKVAVK